MKPGRKILLLLLTAVMVLLLLPQSVMAEEIVQDNGSAGSAGGVITVFATLTDAVSNQTVDIGTQLDDLILPDTLSVTAQVYGEGDTLEEAQEIELTGFTWQSEPEYDPLAGGEYIFTPVLPEGWIAQDGVTLPQITVLVGAAAMPMGMELLSSIPTEYIFDVSEGNITITPSGVGQLTVTYGAGETATFDVEQEITITGSSDTYSVAVLQNLDTVYITLDNVIIENSPANRIACPFSVGAYSTVHLTLSGENRLDATTWFGANDGRNAGLGVPYNATLVITAASTGSLWAHGSYKGAGIGSGFGHSGTVTIDGGTVTAYGSSGGAGIGGGEGGMGTVIINGGTVTARNLNSGAAGIGGGNWQGNGMVTITGGTVTAEGGGCAAGIGGGSSGVGEVTITGGTVTATGGSGGYSFGGAGIGGGQGRDGIVTIDGGTVTAYGSSGGAGIGGGGGGSGTVKINGGSVNASPTPSTVTNNSGSSEYLVTISGLPASVGVSYEVNGGIPVSCSTDNNGKLYLWLSATTGSADTILISAGGSQYTAIGEVSTSTNNFTAYFPLNTSPTAAPGTASGTTTVTASPNTGGDVLRYLVSTSFITPPEMNSTSVPAGAVTSGNNLAATAGDWVGVYELNSSSQVVAFSQIQLSAGDISAVATTINTQPATVVYGGSVTLSATLSPGVAGKTISFSINGTSVGAGTTDGSGVATRNATISLPVGNYPILASFAGDPVYAASSGSAMLTVSPAPLTVTANNKTKVYGSANPAFTASYSGFVLGQDPSILGGTLTLTTPATASSGAGSYAVTPSGLTSVNYAITFVDGTLTVNPAPLTITADNKAKTYGDPNPAFTVSYSGFVLGQDPSILGGILTFTTPATAASGVGSYEVTPSGLTSVNYAITFVDGTLTVTPAALTVTAHEKSKTYGSANPVFTVSYSGLVNGDAASSLAGTLVFTTPATASSGAGTYPVTPSGLTSVNYAITFVDGTLTV
ncbi:MAG TPA: hypothetical protein DEF36_20105, partial [Desulfotomaculum sp.]|nr:hypothetical protein [Desulfotomaculum sp.]